MNARLDKQPVIPDDVIERYLSNLFGTSDPGAALHHMLTASAVSNAHTALGLVDPGQLRMTFYGIAPDGNMDTDQFIAQMIMSAVTEARRNEAVIHFIGLARELYAIIDDENEVTQNLARRLKADRKLEEHPAAIEMTLLYAACSDGRRWTGEHFLTGPKAGTIAGPHLRVGALAPQERGSLQRLIRTAVGL